MCSARHLCARIVVMYAGRMIEGGPKEEVIANPQHPYTKLLIDSSPGPAHGGGGSGGAMNVCRTEGPPRTELANGQRAHSGLHQEGSGPPADGTGKRTARAEVAQEAAQDEEAT
ncbi:hypothetical protein E1262_23850 [Jiangella aurantiaca]|uniref:Oligopeptide/dipeptide ABC transporter C-terminal domain-containing protein n=1 Tax=Jiangella aurantiaca TaxID=2530373 RepID=A0A4R5A878_9ACTN|nr:hypothetical protein [Jiangella aurantiaca]TDD65852.1 hypothetical protein E1262_23850 [Jiangella aurantiaca]